MHFRHIISFVTIFISLILISCDKKRNNTSVEKKDYSAEKERADSIIFSIIGKTKTILINPSKENNIISKKGIKFLIPANAFVTKSGMQPKGNIQITISEYHNPADILISRIPMQYQTKDGGIQMESAGMFSITASAKDEVLQITTGKDIFVQVPSKNTDINFNLYFFDSITIAWVQTTDSLLTSQNESDLATKTQASTQQQIIESESTIKVEWSAVEANKRIIDGKKITLVKPDCSYKNTNFNFTVATDNFPELNLYKETIWIGNSNNEEKLVVAAFENDELTSATIIEREIPLNKYLMAFEFRHTKFNTYMKIASPSELCEVNEEIYFSYYDNRPVDKKKIEKISNKTNKLKKQDIVLRSFTINQLGLWNCDRLYILPKKMIIIPRFRSITTGETYESTTTYMIDKKINSVWTFTKTITLNPDSDNIILFVNEKGRICYARLNKLSETHKEKELNLIIDVEEMVDKPDSIEELDKVLQQI